MGGHLKVLLDEQARHARADQSAADNRNPSDRRGA
jgi:hypothetical protein